MKTVGQHLTEFASKRIAELGLGDSPTNCHGVVAIPAVNSVRLTDGVGLDETCRSERAVDSVLRQMREFYDEEATRQD